MKSEKSKFVSIVVPSIVSVVGILIVMIFGYFAISFILRLYGQ